MNSYPVKKLKNLFGKKASTSTFPIEDLPSDNLEQILSHVDIVDLLQNCRLVNKLWLSIIDRQHLWHLKCERENLLSNNGQYYGDHVHSTSESPPVEKMTGNYRKFILEHVYSRNLIKNSRAAEGMKHWNVTKTGGNGFSVTVDGSKPIENYVTVSGPVYSWCTSFAWCSKSQRIDLHKEGYCDYFLDEIRPNISVSEWIAPRFDCACVHHIEVSLLDQDKGMLDYWEEETVFKQWTNADWSQVHHIFTGYKHGLRYIEFTHSGKDEQFWAGHYGSKFTLSEVKFSFM